MEIRPLREPGKGHWLLARRSIAKPVELAYYVCFGPAETDLEELAAVAGTRWAIEECFEEARGEAGLDQYEARRWDGCTGTSPWPCWPTPAWWWSGIGQWNRDAPLKRGHPGLDESLIPMTVPEVRRLPTRLV